MQASASVIEAPTRSVIEVYRPGDDEPFMGGRQVEYFRRKLLAWKDELLRESRETVALLQHVTAPLNCAPAIASAS